MHIFIKYFILTEIVITNLFYKIVTVSLFHDYLNQVTVFLVFPKSNDSKSSFDLHDIDFSESVGSLKAIFDDREITAAVSLVVVNQ